MSRQARGAAACKAGLAAEDAAARLYAAAGAEVVARRWRRREGEIDLVVRREDALIFVEVKTGAHAREAVTPRQQARIAAAAARYIAETAAPDQTFRFDAAFVDSTGGVDVVENAFFTPW
ncbi:MAG: hypothetical protein EA355_09420 [Rhodobacteraceae bacterium]|nr:MAG: hypothetical protein EA355_09420 [Paracoccaceae bacterium]